MRFTEATRKLIAASAAALALLGATATALMQRTAAPGQSVALCVKDNGQLRMLAGQEGCGPSERRADWTVGGEVTNIQLGEGLVGGREGGTVTLSVDPIIKNFLDGRVYVGTGSGLGIIPNLPVLDGTSELPPIAKLDLPTGEYVIFARLAAVNFTGQKRELGARCRLEAGDDFDSAGTPPLEAGTNYSPLSLQVAHRFDQPGSVVLKCGADARPWEEQSIVNHRPVSIIAVSVSGITKVGLEEYTLVGN